MNDITIIYEDDFVLAINKPSGLLVHPGQGKEKGEETLVDWINEHHPYMKDVGEALTTSNGRVIARPGIVHRLDRDTSGILVLAKTKDAFTVLKKQFANRTLQKTYRAIVYGRIKEDEGTVSAPIGRSRRDPRRRAVVTDKRKRKRDARTDWKVRDRFTDVTYLDVYPKTGRTHQIRVHLHHIQHPVVCDELYKGKRACPSTLGRLALHASSLRFLAPDGTNLSLEAPLPPAFTAFLAECAPL